uniref:phosphoglycerate dehydrogenase n=1 Tax=Lotharella globosa TaxID=91324 RepID=A0A7S3YVA8_9EUKA
MSTDDDINMLSKLLEEAKKRKEEAKSAAAPATDYDGPSFNVQTFNAISPVGLQKYPSGKYKVSPEPADLEGGPHAIMLRSHKLQVEEVNHTVRAIARCGAGTNNIPVDKMTEMGIPVFNTPGANANAVKELVVCGLLLASRGISEGINHVKQNIIPEEDSDYPKIAARIEKDKKMFVGQEIAGKTLGVIGLGHIGSRVVGAALSLGMKVVGYDPALSLDAAWRLPGEQMTRASSIDDLLKEADYISLHVPYIKDKTHHLIDAEALKIMKPGVSICNFARGEIVDGAALRAAYESGTHNGKYVSDFADKDLMGHPNHLVMPHLGASTGEAEENSAGMAADQIIDFLETGSIRNSVNFPDARLDPKDTQSSRLCIVNENSPGVLGAVTSFLGDKGINIEQQINLSRGGIAYTVIDMTGQPDDPAGLQEELGAKVEGILSSRFIGVPFHNELGRPGTFYHVTWFQES